MSDTKMKERTHFNIRKRVDVDMIGLDYVQ